MRNAKAGRDCRSYPAGGATKGVRPVRPRTGWSEIGRIINENCVVCHQEGGIGPMAFENYDRWPWAPLISIESPMGNASLHDQHIGIQDLLGDWRLEQSEIDAIVAWVKRALLAILKMHCHQRGIKDPNE